MNLTKFWMIVGLVLGLVVALSACGGGETEITSPVIETPAPTAEIDEPTATVTPVTPSATPEPAAAVVNGERISLAEYQAELRRYQDVAGRELTQGDEARVLDDLVHQVLLAQGAIEGGFTLSEEEYSARLDKLVTSRGGQDGFNDWMERHHYDADSFRVALTRSIYAAWMRDQVAAAVPEKVEQVHAKQVLLTDEQEANSVFSRLEAGADFDALAFEYDPTTRGELGWFPRGYLFQPAVEEAAFGLEVGQYSEVIASDIGYHIVFVVDRDAERPLSPDARFRLQAAALEEWLEMRRAESEIEILVK